VTTTSTGRATVGPRTRWQRVKAPTLVAGGILGVSVLLHLRDPHRSGSWGYCPWLMLTGTYCPGCGGLRAVNDLTNGDVAGAASSNLLFVVSIPFIAAWWTRTMLDGWRGVVRPANSRRAIIGCLLFSLVALTFWVVRNTGSADWLAP
jgi:Protein of unknown function (DUF2752)